MRGRGDSHELPPGQIKTLKVAQAHLCSLAFYRGRLRPDMCEQCPVLCKYGVKMLEIIGRPIPDEADKTVSVSKLSKQGAALPTLNQRLKKRWK